MDATETVMVQEVLVLAKTVVVETVKLVQVVAEADAKQGAMDVTVAVLEAVKQDVVHLAQEVVKIRAQELAVEAVQAVQEVALVVQDVQVVALDVLEDVQVVTMHVLMLIWRI